MNARSFVKELTRVNLILKRLRLARNDMRKVLTSNTPQGGVSAIDGICLDMELAKEKFIKDHPEYRKLVYDHGL